MDKLKKLQEHVADIEHDTTRRLVALEESQRKLEKRLRLVLGVIESMREKTARTPAGHNARIGEAQSWLLQYLGARKLDGDTLKDVDIPAYADLAWRVLNSGENAGISRTLLREARQRIEGLIEVRHLLKTKKWIWSLTKDGQRAAIKAALDKRERKER